MNLSVLLVILSVAALASAKPAETDVPSQLTVGGPITPSLDLLYSGTFESTSNVGSWSIHLDPRFRIEAFTVNNLVGCRITSITSGIGTFALTLGLEKIPGPIMYFQYSFYGTVMPEVGNEKLSEKFEPQVEIVTE